MPNLAKGNEERWIDKFVLVHWINQNKSCFANVCSQFRGNSFKELLRAKNWIGIKVSKFLSSWKYHASEKHLKFKRLQIACFRSVEA